MQVACVGIKRGFHDIMGQHADSVQQYTYPNASGAGVTLVYPLSTDTKGLEKIARHC